MVGGSKKSSRMVDRRSDILVGRLVGNMVVGIGSIDRIEQVYFPRY